MQRNLTNNGHLCYFCKTDIKVEDTYIYFKAFIHVVLHFHISSL